VIFLEHADRYGHTYLASARDMDEAVELVADVAKRAGVSPDDIEFSTAEEN
jgi:DNA-binding phage protein